MSYGAQYNLSGRVSNLESRAFAVCCCNDTAPTLDAVLLEGNNAGTSNIDMNENDIVDVDEIQTRQLTLRNSGVPVNMTVTATSATNLLVFNGVNGATTLFQNRNAVGTQFNSLILTGDNVKTNTPLLPTNDNSNSIPTTQWINIRLNFLANYVQRAWVRRNNFTAFSITFSINIPNSGLASTIYSQNEMVNFRVTFNQEWSVGVSGSNTIFSSTVCTLSLYPQRFDIGWLSQSAPAPNQYSRGLISSNSIYTSSLNAAYNNTDGTFCPRGRQFFAYDLDYTQSPANGTVAQLNIRGDPTNTNIVNITVVNPSGFNSTSLNAQNFNLSLELVNPCETTAGITTIGFDVGF